MILSKAKPFEKVLESIKDAGSVFIVGCGGCPLGCQSGGEAEMGRLKESLAAGGKKVAGSVTIDFLCNKALVGTRLKRRIDDIRGADRILVMSCGIGVQAVGNMVDKPAVPVLDTVSAGGLQGLWPSTECEVEKDRDCGWAMIYTRVKELGRLSGLKEPIPPRDHRKRDLPAEMRGTPMAALELEPERRQP
jgi:hypothetical protein